MARVALAQCPDGTPPPCGGTASGRAAAPIPGSIAVLPFANRSPDSTDAYLAEGLPEDIVGRLAQVRSLHVKSSTAVAAQWRRMPDAMAAARALRVEWFVTGSLRRVGRQLAVRAELVQVSSGDGVWSAPFRRGDDDLAAIEQQVAESVAVAIVGRLAPAELTGIRRSASRNVEAYRLYLYGRSLTARRTVTELQRAVDAFSNAVRLDPAFASAWGRLGFVRELQAEWGSLDGLSVDSLVALARVAANRALQLDSGLAEGWLVHVSLFRLARDLGAAREACERAVRLDSLSADAYHVCGVLYASTVLGLPDVAEPYFRHALDLDPDLRNSWLFLASVRLFQGRLAEAEALMDTALNRGTWGQGYFNRAIVRIRRGNGAGALADLADAERRPDELSRNHDFSGTRALVSISLGDSAPARALIEALRAAADSGRPNYSELAVLSMALGLRGDALSALESLRAAADPRQQARCGSAPCSSSLATWRTLHDPIFAPLGSDPRFQRLLADTRPHVPWLERGAARGP
jgi:TolB-like protein/Tfp pilus assembly protein PilF